MDTELGGIPAVRGAMINVYRERAGSSLTRDAASADTLLYVEDASDFAEDGGTLSLYDGTTAEYYSVDMENDTITLSAPLGQDILEGKPIQVHPSTAARWAEVVVPDLDDPLTCVVPHALWPFVPVGTRDPAKRQETAIVIQVDDDWLVIDVVGVPRARLGSEHASRNRVLRYTAEGAGVAGYRGVKLTGLSGQVYAAQAQSQGGAVSADATLAVILDGDPISGLDAIVISAGESLSAMFDISDLDFQDNDTFRVEFVDPSDLSPNVVVWVYVRLDVD